MAARIRELVEAGLTAKEVSARRASFDVVGHDGLIRDIRSGKLPGVEKLDALFKYLGLEFYIGPPRDPAPAPAVTLDAEDYAAVRRLDAQASAGPGRFNDDDARVIGHLAFRRDWLRARGINPDRALLITAVGDSMEPAIRAGDLLLIDTARDTIRDGAIHLIRDADGETRVKRLHRLGPRAVALVSDNPEHPAEIRQGAEAERLRVLGRVMWSARDWSDETAPGTAPHPDTDGAVGGVTGGDTGGKTGGKTGGAAGTKPPGPARAPRRQPAGKAPRKPARKRPESAPEKRRETGSETGLEQDSEHPQPAPPDTTPDAAPRN